MHKASWVPNIRPSYAYKSGQVFFLFQNNKAYFIRFSVLNIHLQIAKINSLDIGLNDPCIKTCTPGPETVLQGSVVLVGSTPCPLQDD